MGFVTGPELAAAVSNAGGLGIMSFSGNPPPVLRDQIRRARALTSKPFGVNVLLSGPHLPFPLEAAVDLVIEERVPVLSTFWGDPAPYVSRAHSAGVKVIHQVGAVADARRAVEAGVDVIIAQGVEAGGHIAGEVTTMALVPCVVDAVAPVPVVAAGGIADGRGLAAALALGAQGVMIGTRLIATPEAYAHPVYKEKVLAATEDQTVRTTLFGYGWPHAPHRTLRTPFVERWLGEESRGSEQRPDEPQIGETKIGGQPVPMLRFMGFPPTPDTTGDIASMDFLAGQSVGLVRDIKLAGNVIREIVDGAERIFAQLATEQAGR
jgi:NAD(P)H-dependent flavin oxidoreductase YrpB (nitropropane dioxygenase family)